MGITVSQYDAMMKELYTDQRVLNLAEEGNHRFYKMVKKRGDFVGDALPIPLEYGLGPGRGRTFTNAQANTGNDAMDKFVLTTRYKNYGVARIDGELLHAAVNMGAFVRAADRIVKNRIQHVAKQDAWSLYRSSGGAIGRIASTTNLASTSIDLTVRTDAQIFQKSMVLRFGPNEDGTGLRAGTLAVVAVNRARVATGHVTVSANLNTIAGIATGDYIFVDGDAGKSYQGLADWIPLTTPASNDNFNGVNRSVDPVFLAGHRLNDPSMPIEEAALQLAEDIFTYGGEPDACLLHPSNFNKMALSMGFKVQYDTGDQSGEGGKIGFRAFPLITSSGVVKVMADPDCPLDRGYVLEMKSWTLHHLKPYPHIVDDDGRKFDRVSDDDAIEVRIRSMGALACDAPGHNGVFAIDTN